MKDNRMLIIVDPQVDFVDGSLPVPGAPEAMDALAEYIRANPDRYCQIAITADWHPADHLSFTVNGGQWPVHCVQHSQGAAVWASVMDAAYSSYPGKVKLLTKGDDAGREEYSIFQNQASALWLDDAIRRLAISEIDICGLAGDICVKNTYLDVKRMYGDLDVKVLSQFSPCINPCEAPV